MPSSVKTRRSAVAFHPLNAVSFRRKASVFVPNCSNAPTRETIELVVQIVGNAARWGHALTYPLIERMFTMSKEQLVGFSEWLMPEIKKTMGATRVPKPMYPNFPQQVQDISEGELWLNAIVHYFGDAIGARILPVYSEEQRAPLQGTLRTLRPIGLCEDPSVIFSEILSSPMSPSEADKEDITLCLSLDLPVTRDLVIPCKETLAFSVADAMRQHRVHTASQLITRCGTATDLLRVAVAISGGDVSLAENTKFISFKRSIRRLLLEGFEGLGPQAGEDMMRRQEVFKRLGERLHPGEFKSRWPKAFEVFRAIRNEGVQTFASKVEVGFQKGETRDLIGLLSSRPGEFARRLNHLLQDSSRKDHSAVLEAFEAVADQVSTPVLWQVAAFFQSRGVLARDSSRLFFPKGNVARVISSPVSAMRPIPVPVNQRVVSIVTKALKTRQSTQTPMGRVFLDPQMYDLLLPMGNRSAQASLRQVGRGSRFALPFGKDTVRLFMFWKDQPETGWDGRVDLDLSAIIYDENFNAIDQCSWTNLRSEGMWHSGDITSAPKGASEFLDIHIPTILNREFGRTHWRGSKGVTPAYIACSVTCYTGQKTSELDEAFAGWMAREKPNSGEIYDPRTVEGRVDLRSASTCVVPMILDLRERQVIWADISAVRNGGGRSVRTTHVSQSQIVEAVVEMAYKRPTLHNIIALSVEARGGSLVTSREEADLVIADGGHISPFDVAKITSEFLQ